MSSWWTLRLLSDLCYYKQNCDGKSCLYTFLCILIWLCSKVKFQELKLLDQRVWVICILKFGRLCQIVPISIQMLWSFSNHLLLWWTKKMNFQIYRVKVWGGERVNFFFLKEYTSFLYVFVLDFLVRQIEPRSSYLLGKLSLPTPSPCHPSLLSQQSLWRGIVEAKSDLGSSLSPNPLPEAGTRCGPCDSTYIWCLLFSHL